jgi:hypothetical protein
MARLFGLFAASLLLLLGASLIVGHFRHEAILGQLAEINRGVIDQPVEHRSVGTPNESTRHKRQTEAQ